MTKNEKVIEVIHDLLRIIAFHIVLSERRQRDTKAEEARRVLQNSLMEMYVVKWSLLFLDRKGEKHRVWAVEPFADAFPKYLEDSGSKDDFDSYCRNIFAVRDMYVAHLDDRERVNAAELKWPILEEGKVYLFALRELVFDDANDAIFDIYLKNARAGFDILRD